MECAKAYLRSLAICLGHISDTSGYTVEEKIQIRTQIIGILQILYPEKDYCDEAVILAEEYMVIATLYTQLGERDRALDALESMYAYALCYEAYTGKHTSLAFRDCEVPKWASEEYSYCRDELIPRITNMSSFDPLREEPRYARVIEKLSHPQK